jgi:hypothetical protein
MSQISPPIRILFVGAIAFFAAWMLFLRPGSEAPVAPPAAVEPATAAGGAPAQTAPGQAVEAANNAAAAGNAAAQAVDGTAPAATGTSAATTTPTTPATPPKVTRKSLAKSGLPLPVMRAIADRKVVVLFFHNPKAADDRYMRRQLDRVVDNHGSKFSKRVKIQAAPIKDIARYGQITRGVNVQQSPTIVVVDAKLRADSLVGVVGSLAIDQAIQDALRSTKAK